VQETPNIVIRMHNTNDWAIKYMAKLNYALFMLIFLALFCNLFLA